MLRIMGRRRQQNHNLPPRMHEKFGTFYYVTSTIPRKWISLGRDLAEAKRKWADLESGESSGTSLGQLDRRIHLIKRIRHAFREHKENVRQRFKAVEIRFR